MTRIGGIGSGLAPARRAGRAAGGFAPRGGAGAPDAPAAAAAGAVPGLLALQEEPAPPLRLAERAARRGGAALEELRGLQLDLLRGQRDPGRLARLAALGAAAEDVADPALRLALGEIALRARVELARRRVATASAG